MGAAKQPCRTETSVLALECMSHYRGHSYRQTPGSSEVLKGHAELVETLLMFELAQSHDAIFSMDVGIFYRMV